MDDLIERYVYEVVRCLPEKDREEISKELKSNIYDMLSDDADENEIKRVLYKLGSPFSLAEKYRQKQRYLISPAIYDEYVRILKWVVPLVGILVLAVGMIFGAIEAIGDEMVEASYVISKTISKGISLGLSAAFQALFWTTAGFVIAERTGGISDKSREEWKIEDLPEAIPDDKSKIPLSDSITGLVVTVIFSVAAILLCSGILPVAFIIQNGDTQVHHLFSPGFLEYCIPAITVIALLGICECIIKIKEQRWTPLVCGSVIVNNLLNMGIMIYLVNRPDIFSEEFTAFIKENEWGNFDLLKFGGTGVSYSLLITISIIVVCSLAACGTAIYKTIRARTVNACTVRNNQGTA